MSSPHKKCPSCKKSFKVFEGITWAFGPFCSRRCQDADLLAWLKAEYALPGSESVIENPGPIDA